METLATSCNEQIYNGETRSQIQEETYRIINTFRSFIGESVMNSVDPHSRFSERCHWFGGYPKTRESIDAEIAELEAIEPLYDEDVSLDVLWKHDT